MLLFRSLENVYGTTFKLPLGLSGVLRCLGLGGLRDQECKARVKMLLRLVADIHSS